LLSKLLRLFKKPFFEWLCLYETMPRYHCAYPCFVGRERNRRSQHR
jgi:hypothetical protein